MQPSYNPIKQPVKQAETGGRHPNARGLKAGTGKPPGRGLVECLAFDPRPQGLGYGKGHQSSFAGTSGARKFEPD
jgi:hypothetical protein